MPEGTTPDVHGKAAELGIATNHEAMSNGEFRFRLTAGDGSSYVRTVASGQGSWQQSHFHHSIRETYIVQSGWAALAEYRDSAVVWHILQVGDVVTTVPYVPHNVYLPADAVLHCVKHGNGGSSDWHPHEELDKLTVHLTEAQIPVPHDAP